MPQLDDLHVKAENCLVLWDAITRPDTSSDSGKQKWSLKLAIHPASPDAALIEQLAAQALQNSEFRGVLPSGGTMPLGVLGPNEYGGQFNGWRVFNAGTYRGVPDPWIDGQRVDVMQVGGLLYGGQMVDVVVHTYVNNKKVKGVALGLDGFNIRASENAPRLDFGGGPSFDTSAAFGGGYPSQQQQAGGNYQQQNGGGNYQQQQAGGNYQQQNGGGNYQQQNGGGNYQQQNGGGNYQQQQAGGYQPQQQAGGGYQPQQQQAGGYQPQQQAGGGYQPQQQAGGGNYPSQAHDFLPQ